MTPTDSLLEQARALSTAEVSDALDFFRLPGSVLGVAPVAGPARLFGPAFTVRFAPVDTAVAGTVGDFLDDVPIGAIAVLDNGGRLDCTVWGGIMSRVAAARGVGGTVVHGVCRDTAEAAAAGYPLYARARFMRTGKDRVQVEALQAPVSLGDVRVCPGDFVIGDADGVLVVPAGPRGRSVRARAQDPRGRVTDSRSRAGRHEADRCAPPVRLSQAATAAMILVRISSTTKET